MVVKYGVLHLFLWFVGGGAKIFLFSFGCLVKKVKSFELLVRKIIIIVWSSERRGFELNVVVKDFWCWI